MALCAVLYLAWWVVFFRPDAGKVQGPLYWIGAGCLVVAAIAGITGAVFIALGASGLAAGTGPNGWWFALGAIAAYILLAWATAHFWNRPITTELLPSYDGADAAVAAATSEWVSAVDDMLGEEIAVGDSKFYITDPATGKRRIRSGETNLGDFVADGIYAYFNEIEDLHCDIAIMNGGGIRANVDAGPWSFKTCKTVSPFGNVACLMSVTGQQILDALEFGARFAGAEGKENGGFLQVAGAKYEIHAMVPNTVQTDDKNVWVGSATTPRVSNVEIYDKTTGTYKPLDPNATYALAGMNYTLRNLGDGFAMFDGAELIKDYVSEDYLVMSSYAAMFGGVDANGLPHLASANSPLADYPGYLLNYEDPYGAGRIQMIW